MNKQPIDQSGWAFPLGARKAHYFQAGSQTSLCRRWTSYRGSRSDDMAQGIIVESDEDCVVCRRELERELKRKRQGGHR